jgi:hypothetical protein
MIKHMNLKHPQLRLPAKYSLLLLVTLVWQTSCGASSNVESQPSHINSQNDQLKSQNRQLCDNLKEIKRIPFSQEPVSDEAYNQVVRAGPAAIPCLVDSITDTTKMADPRSEPTFEDFRVGDLAFFLLVKLHHVPFEEMLPRGVQARLKDEGVYAYFRFVSSPRNRERLKEAVQRWIQHKQG